MISSHIFYLNSEDFYKLTKKIRIIPKKEPNGNTLVDLLIGDIVLTFVLKT